MPSKSIIHVWLLILGCIFYVQTAQAEVFSSVDRTTIPIGEAVILTLTAQETNAKPDLSVLERDFDIASRRQESRLSFVNGVRKQQSSWILTLYPKNQGKVSIPVIYFNQERTLPIALTVSDAVALDGGAAPDIIVEYKTDNENPYVQQQIIVKQRLLYRVALQQGQVVLGLPEIESGKGVLRQTDKNISTKEERDGENYQVIERQFALVAQQSGELTIGRTVFEGILVENPMSGVPSRYYAVPLGRSVRRYSPKLTLNIQPQHPSYTGQFWLPADDISISAGWSKPLDQLKPGEPVTLTLGITAVGLLAEQLPSLVIKPPMGIKAYADKPTFNNQINNDGVVGIRQENWVLMATDGGEYTLPEITLTWWNIKTNQQETARLAATAFYVHGNAEAGQSSAATSKSNKPTSDAAPESKESNESQDGLAKPLLSETGKTMALPQNTLSLDRWLLWLIAGLFVGSILVVIWWRHGRRQAKRALSNAYQGRKALLTACRLNDAPAAYRELMVLARDELQLRAPVMQHLHEQSDPDLQVALTELNQALYGDKKSVVWNGHKLLKAIERISPKHMPKKQAHYRLEPLYPE